ncbi:MAG: phosphopantetheine-binding protein [Treponema sp.]|jgi:acyl carrier protein|nr:phosphopantetheine-binding protein [Treponema sp.]
MTKDDIFLKLKEVLTEEFEIDSDTIKPESQLYADLDLDSIDAVDMIVRMKEFTQEKIDPVLFKNVRTVQDVVDMLYPLVQAAAPRS